MISNALKKLYNVAVRPYTRKKICMCNGVAVKRVHLLDRTEAYPEFKMEFVDPLADEIRTGDTVVQVGAGVGVSTVIAAEQSGITGRAITFEAGGDQLAITRETLELNEKTWQSRAPVDLRHALVGNAVRVPGDLGDPDLVDPVSLPECDLLGLDCEGAELEILRNMSKNPDRVVVESHGWLGSSTDEVRSELVDRGYRIREEIEQRPKKDNFVLVGHQRE